LCLWPPSKIYQSHGCDDSFQQGSNNDHLLLRAAEITPLPTGFHISRLSLSSKFLCHLVNGQDETLLGCQANRLCQELRQIWHFDVFDPFKV
jgi:hypothetical protein